MPKERVYDPEEDELLRRTREVIRRSHELIAKAQDLQRQSDQLKNDRRLPK